MALILKGAVKLYYYLNDDIADQRVQNWPLMRTPWPGVALLAVYLLTVLKWIPKYMEKRPAFDLRRILFVYNFIQVLLCIYVTYQSLKLGWLNNYSLFCQPLENTPEADEYAWKVCYVYFCIKLTDLFDTLFFVLRKKQNQVSFLHVYHHWGMVAVSWSMVKWLPGGHTSLLVPINSIVHIIMYTYYMLTTWDDAYKKSLWWKKYVTQIQIIQFTLLLIHFTALVLIEDCPFPRVPSYILIPQNLFMVLLFSEFYYRSYIKTPTVKNK